MAAPVAFAGALAPSPRDRSARASSSSRARAAAPPPSGRPRLGRVIRSSSSPRDAHASHDESDESAGPPLGVVLTHVSADFDTLSSAVGLAKLRDEINQATGGWDREARRVLASAADNGGENVLVTASHLVAAFGKLLL